MHIYPHYRLPESAGPNDKQPMQRLRYPLALCLVGAGAFLLTYLSIQLTAKPQQISAIWPANAILLVLVLSWHRGKRTSLLLAIFIGQLFANYSVKAPISVATMLTIANVTEIFVAAKLIRCGTQTQLLGERGLFRLFIAAIVASGISASIGSATLFVYAKSIDMITVLSWFASSTLGMLIFTPIGLTLFYQREQLAACLTRNFAYRLFALVVVSAIVFMQSGLALLFLIPPLLILLANRGGIPGAAIGVLALTLIATPLVVMGMGPISVTVADSLQGMLIYQLFLGASSFIAFAAGAAASQRQKLIVELRCAEAKYRSIVDNSNDIMLKYDTNGIISYASPAIAVVGVKPSDVVGRPLTALISKEDHDHLWAVVSSNFEKLDQASHIDRQFKVAKSDGGYLWFEGSPQIVRDTNGDIVEIISTFRDVTERVNKAATLAEARAAAELAVKTKTEFLSNMSHEIRTPLNGVLGMAQVLEETSLTASQKSYVETILDSGQSLMTIINDILDLSKIEAGMMELSLMETELRPRLEMFQKVHAITAEKRGLSLDVFVHPNVPETLIVDPVRVRQCVENLVTNALKFTREGGVQVSVSCEQRSESAHKVTVHVVDTGIGMKPEACERVFEPFIQADGSTTRVYGGTGLGLPIARKLARAMGGDIKVCSELGRGAVFTLTFLAEAPVANSLQSTIKPDRADRVLESLSA